MTSFPTLVFGIILLSGAVLGDPQGIDANGVRFGDLGINTAGIRHINLPARGGNYNPFTDSKANAAKQVEKFSPSEHTAFFKEMIAGSALPGSDPAPNLTTLSSLPALFAALDSGCTGSCTGVLERLINLKPCKGVHTQASGRLSYCFQKGDLPVFAKSGTGEFYRGYSKG